MGEWKQSWNLFDKGKLTTEVQVISEAAILRITRAVTLYYMKG